MNNSADFMLSVVVPVYNEALALENFHAKLWSVLESLKAKNFEVIYCDDGSSDDTASLVQSWHNQDKRVKLLKLTRNFGKEYALSAGITVASGDAVITLDGDGQHPAELIPDFVGAWQAGAKVVVGLRTNDSGRSLYKRSGSRLFYTILNHLSSQKLIPGSTDFRLIDKAVRRSFLELHETDRITRGLIDWLGYKQAYVNFESPDRAQGDPAYSNKMLMKLAITSLVSLSPLPLYLFGYLGVLISTIAALLGGSILLEQLLLGDPWHWRFSGTAMLSILLLFLVGVILMSQGLLSLYVSFIHKQSKNRPLYVIDYDDSAGIKKPGA